MQQQEFEQSMSKFFDKAGVRIIKKEEGYEDNINFPSYILLDSKRGSYYAAETDVYDNITQEENAVKFAQDSLLSQNSATALYALSRTAVFMDKTFTLNTGDDLSGLKYKSALIISEENSLQVKQYLENQGYSIQTVPLKNVFLVIFIDEGDLEKLSLIYKKYTKNNGELDDIAPVFEPKDDTTPENIDLNKINNNINNNFDAETPIVSPQDDEALPLLNTQDLQSDTQNNISSSQKDETKEEMEEDELLESIDLNDLITPKEDENAPKNDTESDLLYGKFLKEQTEKIEVSNTAPVEKSIDDIPEGIIDEEDIKEMEDSHSKSNQADDKKLAKAKEEKKAARLAKKEAEKEFSKKGSFLDLPGKIFANIAGLFFFFPSYILNKITGRFLPPFIIYWIAAVVAVFGVYQVVFSMIPQPYLNSFQTSANEAIQLMQSYGEGFKDGGKTSVLVDTSISMVKTSAVMFYGYLHGIDLALNKGLLLHYLLSFAAVLLIIPAFRNIGKLLTVFSIISYFIIPLAVYYQSKIIEYIFKLSEPSLTASSVTFLVYIYPVVLLFILLFLSSAFIPDKNKRREVLP